MYTGYKVNTNKSISSIQTKRGLSETKVESLQKEIDHYTRRIEQEKRKHASVQQNYTLILKEYQEEKNKLDELKKSNATGEITALFSKIKSLQGTLDKSVSLYDDTLAQNNKLRTQIDRLRRDKKNYKQIYKNLEEQIKKADLESAKKMTIIDQKKNRTENLKNQIIIVRQRNEEDKVNTMRQFESLEKNYMEEKRMREAAKLNEKIQKIQIIDTQPLLKMRLKKLIAKNGQKMRVIQEYQNNIKRIESAFEQIKKGSGINDLEEITNNFIESEQQNYSLYNYVDVLTQNISSLEEQYKDLEKKIAEQELENKKRKGNLQIAPQQRSQKDLTQIRQHQQKAQQLTQFVQDVSPELKKVLIALAKSKYNDDPNKLHDYEINGININERNIEEYLSDLEKYINILIEQKNQHTQDTTRASIQNISVGRREDSGKYTSVIIKPEEFKIKQQDNTLMNSEDMKNFAKQYMKDKRMR